MLYYRNMYYNIYISVDILNKLFTKLILFLFNYFTPYHVIVYKQKYYCKRLFTNLSVM